jgi:ureidoglycolate lyase/seryl-tRNA synthetase
MEGAGAIWREQINPTYAFHNPVRNNGGHPFVMLMAKPSDDVQPSDFVAFHSDGSLGFHVDAGVWHQAALTAADADVFDNKQGAVHACVLCDFPDEFGVYLSVPLDGATRR